MTISSASKLVNFRAPALGNLIRRHLLHPSPAAASTHLLQSATATKPVANAHIVDPLAKEGFYPRCPTNFNIEESNSPLCFNATFRFSVMQFEAARKLVSWTSEDDGSQSGGLADGGAYCAPKGRKASYDTDDKDAYRDSDDSDGYDDTFKRYGYFDKDDYYSDKEDDEEGSDDYSSDKDDVLPLRKYRNMRY